MMRANHRRLEKLTNEGTDGRLEVPVAVTGRSERELSNEESQSSTPMTTQRDSFYRTDNESRASLQRGFVMEDLADHSVLEASYTNFPFGTSLATSSWNSRDGFPYTPADRVCGIRDPWGDECQFSEVSFARTALPGTKKPMRPNCRARIPWRGPHVPAPLPNRSSYLEQFAVQKQSQERTGCGDAEKNNKRCISFDLNTMVAPSTTRTDCRSPFLLVCGEEGHPGGGSGGFTLRPCRPPRVRCRSKHTGPGTGVQASMPRGDIVRTDCRAAASMDCETEPQKEVERELASPKNVPVVRRKVRNAPLKRWSSVDDTEFKHSLAPQFLATCRMPTGKEKEEVRKEVDDVETSDEEPSANGSFNMNRGVRESVCLQEHAYEEPEVTPEEPTMVSLKLAHSVRTIRTSASQKRLNSILESGSALGRYDKNSSVSFSNLTASRIGLWAERFGSVDDTAFDNVNNDERRKKETLQSSGYSSATSKTNCEQQRPEKSSHESTSRSVREVKLSESPTKVHSFSPKNPVDLKPPKPIKSKRRMIPRSKTSEISSNLDFMRINVDCDASDPPQVLLKLNSPLWDEQHRAIVCLLQATETLEKDDEVTSEWLQNWTEVQIHSLLQSLTVAVTNLRSQVSRAAIHLIRNLSHKLGNKRLEAEAFHLIPSLLSRIGGDSSTAFIRAEAHDCLFVLIGKINPLCAVGCLNTAVNSGHGRSSVGRSAIAAALAAVLPGLVGLEGWQQAKAGRFEAIRTTMDLRGKRKECFDRLVKNVATFLADGNQETRQCGRSMLRALIHVAGFENYCFHILSERSWLTVRDSLEKMGLRTNPRSTSKARKLDPLRTRSVLKRSASCPRTDPTSLAPVLSKAAPKGNPVARKDDPGRRLRILIADLAATDPQETLKSLRQLGRKVAANKLDVCSPDLKQLTFGICRLLNHSTEEVVLHAANFCIDARRLLGVPAPSLKSVPTSNFPAFANDLTSGGGEPGKDLQKAELTEEKFPPGLLALLFLHEDAEGFTGVLDIFANQLACSNPDVAYLAREACEKTRKILGPEALVKPLLHGQRFQEDPDKRAILIEELSDVTADLDTSCVLLDQYLVPEVLQLTSVATQFPDSQRLQSAVQSFVRCVYNQAGDTLLQAAKSADASEPLETTLECS
nr:unnamed protein product [Spirometra erinaceieuropaei]